MNEGDALLADIFENPDDDAPRLIYADWLDDHGQSDRAEVIRIQCRLKRDEDEHSPEDEEQLDRADYLIEQREAEWTANLPDGGLAPGSSTAAFPKG